MQHLDPASVTSGPYPFATIGSRFCYSQCQKNARPGAFTHDIQRVHFTAVNILATKEIMRLTDKPRKEDASS